MSLTINRMFLKSFNQLSETATYKEDYAKGVQSVDVDLFTGLVTLTSQKLTFYRFIPSEHLEALNQLKEAQKLDDLQTQVLASTKVMLKQLSHSRIIKSDKLFEAAAKKTLILQVHSPHSDNGSKITVGGLFHEPGKSFKNSERFVVIWVPLARQDDFGENSTVLLDDHKAQ